MIESIVEPKAFQRGHEYFKGRRVRLLEATNRDISATVQGNSGMFEQTVRLRDGNLITACTCTLIEQPMCRHCVAVLLEYHRWSAQRTQAPTPANESRRGSAAGSHSGHDTPLHGNGNGNGNGHVSGNGHASDYRPTPNPAPVASSAAQAASATGSAIDRDVRLSDVIAFMEWVQPAMGSLAQGTALPTAPQFASGMVSTWVQTLTDVNRRHQEQVELVQALHADLATRDAELDRLRQQFKQADAELQASRKSSTQLQRDVEAYQAVIGKIGDLATGIGRFSADVKAVTGDLSKSQNQLERLAQSFQDVSQSLQSLAKTRSS